jgi:hypothetical protein
MHRSSRFRLALLLLSVAASGEAAIISGFGPVTGSATGSGVAVTPNPSNDNVFASPNTFAFSLNVTGFGSINHPILASPPLPITEYRVDATILNSTSLPIIGWQFRLPGTPYDFDFPDFDSLVSSSLGWTINVHTDNTLEFLAGAPLLPGNSMAFTFAIDVPLCTFPPGTPNLVGSLGDPGLCGFASTPIFAAQNGGSTSPEPGTLWLVSLPLAFLFLRRRLRQ